MNIEFEKREKSSLILILRALLRYRQVATEWQELLVRLVNISHKRAARFLANIFLKVRSVFV